MKIRDIRLRNFKRFSDVLIGEIPREARLVVLVGPNGCGKSSVIDAAHLWRRLRWARHGGWDASYHRKQVPGAVEEWNQAVQILFHEPQPVTEEQGQKAVYVRTAYRNDPEFQ